MRIQETDRILKESRIARNNAEHSSEHGGSMSRAWHAVSSIPQRLAGMFRRNS